MPKQLTGRELIKQLANKLKCKINPGKGRHYKVMRIVDGKSVSYAVPFTREILRPGLLNSIKRHLKISDEEWQQLFE